MQRVTFFALTLAAAAAHAQPTDPVPDQPPPPPVEPTEPAPPAQPDPVQPRPAPPVEPPVVAAPIAKDERPAIKVAYDRGVSMWTADKAFRLRIAFRNQIRFESLRATEDGSESLSKFSIPRSRLTLEGNVFGEGNRLKLEVAFGDVGGFGFVKDLTIDRKVGSNVWVRAGQWKRPFNRQELVSDFGSEFNERAITAAFVGGGRDLGVAIHNDYEKSPKGLEWVIGVFNGFNGGADKPNQATTCKQDAATGAITCTTTAPTTVPIDFGPAIVARIGWNSADNVKGYTEGDFEGGAPRYGVGISYKVDLANFAKHNLDDDAAKEPYSESVSYGVEADAMLKAHGFGLELGAYAMRVSSRLDPKITTIQLEYGVMVQPGYFVVPKHLQVAGRFAYSPDRPGGRDLVEVRGALNYYWHGHEWKLATDVGALKFTEDDPKTMKADKPDFQLRTMPQLAL